MFDGISRSDPGPSLERTHGTVRLGFRRRDDRTALSHLYQAGAGKARFPRVEPGLPPEAVLINTAGGLTGGDRLTVDVAIESDAMATVTTQACERIYRSAGNEARVETCLSVGQNATLHWLPQETILFDRSQLRRHLDIDLRPQSRLLAIVGIVFGRRAMGESVREAAFRDSWRVRRDGKLIFADGARFSGGVGAMLSRPALLGGNGAYATLLMVDPDVGQRLGMLRSSLPETGVGASVWDGMLVARIVAETGQALRRLLVAALTCLRDGAPLPRVWNC
ncbi:MAG: urease accessory protein UreD [Alphaproteobacteria bacterium]